MILTLSRADDTNIFVVKALNLRLCRRRVAVNKSGLVPCAVDIHLPNDTNREGEKVSQRGSHAVSEPQLSTNHVRISDVPGVVANGVPISI